MTTLGSSSSMSDFDRPWYDLCTILVNKSFITKLLHKKSYVRSRIIGIMLKLRLKLVWREKYSLDFTNTYLLFTFTLIKGFVILLLIDLSLLITGSVLPVELNNRTTVHFRPARPDYKFQPSLGGGGGETQLAQLLSHYNRLCISAMALSYGIICFFLPHAGNHC